MAIDGASEMALRGDPSLLEATEVGNERNLGNGGRAYCALDAPAGAWLLNDPLLCALLFG